MEHFILKPLHQGRHDGKIIHKESSCCHCRGHCRAGRHVGLRRSGCFGDRWRDCRGDCVGRRDCRCGSCCGNGGRGRDRRAFCAWCARIRQGTWKRPNGQISNHLINESGCGFAILFQGTAFLRSDALSKCPGILAQAARVHLIELSTSCLPSIRACWSTNGEIISVRSTALQAAHEHHAEAGEGREEDGSHRHLVAKHTSRPNGTLSSTWAVKSGRHWICCTWLDNSLSKTARCPNLWQLSWGKWCSKLLYVTHSWTK